MQGEEALVSQGKSLASGPFVPPPLELAVVAASDPDNDANAATQRSAPTSSPPTHDLVPQGQSLSAATNKADDHYAAGIERVRSRDYLGAIRCFSKTAFLAPGEPLPYVARAEAYAQLCDLSSAISNYRKALTLIHDTVAAEDLRLRLAQILDTQGLCYLRSGDNHSALQCFEEALESQPSNAIVVLHRCLSLIRLGRSAEAEPQLSTISKDPTVEADVAVLRIHLVLKRDDFVHAKQLLEEVLVQYAKHPRVLDAERRFDESFHKFRSKAEAELDVEALTRCIAAFGEDADLYRLRAVAHVNRKSYTLAVQDLFSCINKNGGTSVVASEMMASTLALIADELADAGDYSTAVHYYTECTKWNPDFTGAYAARGDCLSVLGKHDAALEDFKFLLAKDPTDETVQSRLGALHNTWGSVLYNEGKFQLAEIEFSHAISYFAKDPTFYYHRALCRLMLRDPVLAIRDLVSCRDLNTTDPDIVKLVEQFCRPRGGMNSVDAPQPSKGDEACAVQHPQKLPVYPERRFVPGVGEVRLRKAGTVEEQEVEDKLFELRTDHASLLESKYNPSTIRQAIKRQKGVGAATTKETFSLPAVDAGCAKQRKSLKSPPSEPPKKSWSGSSKIGSSRLDRIAVSAPEPIPQRYSIKAPRASQPTEDASADVALLGIASGIFASCPKAITVRPQKKSAISISARKPHAAAASTTSKPTVLSSDKPDAENRPVGDGAD